MMLCDEKGRGIISDWHPNGQLRTVSRYYLKQKMFAGWEKHFTGVHLEQEWARTVIEDDGGYIEVTEKEWRAIPGVEKEITL